MGGENWPYFEYIHEYVFDVAGGSGVTHRSIDDGLDMIDLHGCLRFAAAKFLRDTKGYSLEKLVMISKEIDLAVSQFREDSFNEEMDDYIHSLALKGGWELAYLPEGSAGTESDIRWLLENWSPEWDDRPRIPRADDITLLDGLDACVGDRQFDEEYKESFSFSVDDRSHLYSVVGLMIICELLKNVGAKKRRGDLSRDNLIEIGSASVQVVSVISIQESWLAIRAQANKNDRSIQEEFKRRSSERARHIANLRHAPMEKAREWVKSEWVKNSSEYKGNKSQFAREYSRRVKNEFKDAKGEPIVVVEKTIREVWLKGVRLPASG